MNAVCYEFYFRFEITVSLKLESYIITWFSRRLLAEGMSIICGDSKKTNFIFESARYIKQASWRNLPTLLINIVKYWQYNHI